MGTHSPERAALPVKFIIGENDPGFAHCSENWEESKAKLLSYGHTAAKLEMEVIKKDNAEHLGAGHQWYPARIFDFCIANERTGRP